MALSAFTDAPAEQKLNSSIAEERGTTPVSLIAEFPFHGTERIAGLVKTYVHGSGITA
jgi:hypothetical protein